MSNPTLQVQVDAANAYEALFAEQVLGPFLTPGGTVAFDCPAHIVTGTGS